MNWQNVYVTVLCSFLKYYCTYFIIIGISVCLSDFYYYDYLCCRENPKRLFEAFFEVARPTSAGGGNVM